MPVKAAEIRGFQPIDTLYRRSDDRGLYLEIRPNGSKHWFLKRYVDIAMIEADAVRGGRMRGIAGHIACTLTMADDPQDRRLAR